MKQFSPLVEFTCKELGGSVYVPGLTYTVREEKDIRLTPEGTIEKGEEGHLLLQRLTAQWEEEGKISFGIVTEGLAQGKG